MRAIGIVRMFAAIAGAISVAAPARRRHNHDRRHPADSGGAAYIGQGIGDGIRLAVDQINVAGRRRPYG
jgi:hypothetical protein